MLPVGLLAQAKKDVNGAYDIFMRCWMKCDEEIVKNVLLPDMSVLSAPLNSYAEIRGEALLRIAIIRKDTGALDIAMQICDQICADVATTNLSSTIGTSALCLKVRVH